MSFIYNYFYKETNLTPEDDDDDEKFVFIESENKYLITLEDLKSSGLKPINNVIPNPSRNMPLINTLSLIKSNKAQLDEILNIKLRPTIINKKQTYYPPRNPVILELNKKFGIGIKV